MDRIVLRDDQLNELNQGPAARKPDARAILDNFGLAVEGGQGNCMNANVVND